MEYNAWRLAGVLLAVSFTTMAAAPDQGPAAQPTPFPQYQQFLGAWTCAKAGDDRERWLANLDVSLQRDGSLDFTEHPTGTYSGPVDHFYLQFDPKTAVWTQTDPMEPFQKTGTMEGGMLTLSEPKPSPLRMRIDVASDDQSITMLDYNANPSQQQLNYQPETVRCTRSGK
jgi:hypothetical protein